MFNLFSYFQISEQKLWFSPKFSLQKLNTKNSATNMATISTSANLLGPPRTVCYTQPPYAHRNDTAHINTAMKTSRKCTKTTQNNQSNDLSPNAVPLPANKTRTASRYQHKGPPRGNTTEEKQIHKRSPTKQTQPFHTPLSSYHDRKKKKNYPRPQPHDHCARQRRTYAHHTNPYPCSLPVCTFSTGKQEERVRSKGPHKLI